MTIIKLTAGPRTVIRITPKTGGASVSLTNSGKTIITIAKKGVQGVSGTPGGSYEHQQLATSDTWVINHNLGIRPTISCYSIGSAEIKGDVFHISTGQAQVTFVTPISGYAHCS